MEALKAHTRDTHDKPKAVNLVLRPAPAPTPKFIECRGNHYSLLSNAGQFALYNQLVASCHTHRCLKYKGYTIPSQDGKLRREYSLSPPSEITLPKRKAVVLDCEMVGIRGGRSELVNLTLIDFITGELLINSLVKPRVPIVDWRSEIHGIDLVAMVIAEAQKEVLDGWQQAREEVYKHINKYTVMVGQSLNQDLTVLRMAHLMVVDSAILTSEAVFGRDKKAHRNWGLSALCKDLVGINIREHAPVSSEIHDSLEDVLATREIVLMCLLRPECLSMWSVRARTAFEQDLEQKKKNQKEAAERRKQEKQKEKRIALDEDEDEDLRWEDVIDWDMWPKSPPDSD